MNDFEFKIGQRWIRQTPNGYKMILEITSSNMIEGICLLSSIDNNYFLGKKIFTNYCVPNTPNWDYNGIKYTLLHNQNAPS